LAVGTVRAIRVAKRARLIRVAALATIARQAQLNGVLRHNLDGHAAAAAHTIDQIILHRRDRFAVGLNRAILRAPVGMITARILDLFVLAAVARTRIGTSVVSVRRL
jgi:hypothetical protein